MAVILTRRARSVRATRLARRGWSAALGLMLVASQAASATEWSGEKAARADTLVTHFLERIDRQEPALPKAALVYGVATRDGLIASQAYREAAPGVPASIHTVFRVGSLAKQFTAAGMLDLIARGATLRDGTRFSFDLALSRIFSGVEHWQGLGGDPDRQPVTLRSLLTMTSNLPNFTRRPPAAADPWGRIAAPDLLAEIKRFNPSGWPNTFEYSNTSYFLLAEAMEEAVVPGEAAPYTHHTYLRDVIFRRAGLADTGFVGDEVPDHAFAVPVYRRAPVFDQPDWLKGSADVVSSVADLAAWNAAIMGGRVLPDAFRAEMLSDGARVTPDIYYGMGWFIEHHRDGDLFSHSGLVPGFTSYNAIATDSKTAGWISVTILINTDVAEGMETLARDLLRIVKE